MSLGIAESTEDVKKIIATVDKDGSGQIEFGEFLGIIKAKTDNSGNNSVLINFFKGFFHKCYFSIISWVIRYDKWKFGRRKHSKQITF